jgi:hypothetical protein
MQWKEGQNGEPDETYKERIKIGKDLWNSTLPGLY